MIIKDFLKLSEEKQVEYLLSLEEKSFIAFTKTIKRHNGKMYRKLYGKVSSLKREKSLLGSAGIEVENNNSINIIKLEYISPNPYQPRKYFDEKKLKELADSIKEHSLISPILLSKVNDQKYIIVAGERRFRAAEILYKENELNCTIEAKVLNNVSDEKLKILALLENINREDLSLRELSTALKKYNIDGVTTRDIAKQTGYSLGKVARYVKVGSLSSDILDKMEELNVTSVNAMEFIADIEDKNIQFKLLEYSSNGHSVEKLKDIYKKISTESFSDTQNEIDQEIDFKYSMYKQAMATSKIISKAKYGKLDEEKKEKVDDALKRILDIQEEIKKIL